MSRAARAAPADRVASAFVVATMLVLCLVLWIAVPAGGIWLAGRIAGTFGPQLALALAFVLGGMLVVATILMWLNDLYLRVTGGEVEIDEDLPVRRGGPLEAMLLICLAASVVALIVWFLAFAENPAVNVY